MSGVVSVGCLSEQLFQSGLKGGVFGEGACSTSGDELCLTVFHVLIQ
jgi:hypothetical protein